MDIKINKEIKNYHESIFFGLSVRQFFCALGAVGVAVGVYFLCKDALIKEVTSWLCIVCAAPLAIAGFFRYNGMTFERFLWVAFKSMVLLRGRRLYRSENLYDQLMKAESKKGRHQ